MIGPPRKRKQARQTDSNTVLRQNKVVFKNPKIAQQNRGSQTESKKPKRSIPHRLALTWETTDLCHEMQNAVDSWNKIDPTLIVNVFDRRQREELVEFDPKVKKAYHLVSRNSAKADIWRLAYLYINGGFYSDIDHICKIPLNRFIPNDAEFVISTRHSSNPTQIPATNNALLGARPRCKIIRYLLESICENVITLSQDRKGKKILNDSKGHAITGPWIISKLLNKFANKKEGIHWRKGEQNIRGVKAFFLEHTPRTGFFVDGKFVIQEKYDGYEKAKELIQK